MADDPCLDHLRLEVMDQLGAAEASPEGHTMLDALDRLEGFVQPLLNRQAKTDKTRLQDFQPKAKGRGGGKGN